MSAEVTFVGPESRSAIDIQCSIPRKVRSMKTQIGIFVVLGMLLTPFAAQAGQANVVLDVHHAGCVLCGPIVKSTLTHVKGVTSVSVSQADGNADVVATITYDNAQTSPAAMIEATTGRGYPAEISKPAKS